MTDRDLKRANLTIISPKILVENKLSVALLLCFPYPRISKSKDLNSREKSRQAVQMGTGAFTSAPVLWERGRSLRHTAQLLL